MKRALGKPEEALAIYTALLEKDGTDSRSRDGKILALFDAGKRTDAETELAKAITCDPALCRDAAGLFNFMTGYASPASLEKIAVAPLTRGPEVPRRRHARTATLRWPEAHRARRSRDRDRTARCPWLDD